MLLVTQKAISHLFIPIYADLDRDFPLNIHDAIFGWNLTGKTISHHKLTMYIRLRYLLYRGSDRGRRKNVFIRILCGCFYYDSTKWNMKSSLK